MDFEKAFNFTSMLRSLLLSLLQTKVRDTGAAFLQLISENSTSKYETS